MNRQFEDRLKHFLSEEEFNEVQKTIDIIRNKKDVKMVFTHDKEIFIAHLNLKRIFDKMMPMKLPKDTPACFYTILPSVADDLIVIILTAKPLTNHVLDLTEVQPHDFTKKHNSVVIDRLDAERKKIHLQCSDVSHYTFFPNFMEIIAKNELHVSEIHIAQALAIESKRNKSFFDVVTLLERPIEEERFASIADDFRRYIKTRIKAMSIFDLVGPAMVGPSSSHTAGASRIGLLSRHIIEAVIESGEQVKSIEVKLFASFRDTGVAHKTPHAIGGGLSGFATDDAELLAHGDPDFLRQNGFDMKGCMIDFLGYKKGSAEEEQKYAQQQGHNIAEIIFTSDKATHCITGFSIGGGNIEIRYFDGLLNTPINGKNDMRLVGGAIVACDENNASYPTIAKIFSDEAKPNPPQMPFNTFEEMLRYAKGRRMIDVIIETETLLQNTDKQKIYSKMASYWNIMESAVHKGLQSKELSLFKLSGRNASMLDEYIDKNALFDNLFGRAIAYAVAVNETNAKSGLIVACPTAGSCGILPGVLKAYDELRHPSQEHISEALMVAGFFGMILFDDVSTAGADYGCQAEVGAASAMAAAALTYLEGGDNEQMVEAFTIAIKNVLGLICDPVAGLVEVPCVKRNGMYATQAISAAMMALSGVKSFISPDEVMLTMQEVGQRLNVDYKETSRAGLAKTRDGKAVEDAFAGEIKKFFG
ncbi:MAG: L-serine ammonia-lyase, iron-sulfur-dependent, subunit alpha [Bacteroidales bacterium]|nr:L-serine ammonia-lyase, iron-sulfur-dependent, subunit alpha [Bacteroidales bacterium]